MSGQRNYFTSAFFLVLFLRLNESRKRVFLLYILVDQIKDVSNAQFFICNKKISTCGNILSF